jgi:hypothetical protein
MKFIYTGVLTRPCRGNKGNVQPVVFSNQSRAIVVEFFFSLLLPELVKPQHESLLRPILIKAASYNISESGYMAAVKRLPLEQKENVIQRFTDVKSFATWQISEFRATSLVDLLEDATCIVINGEASFNFNLTSPEDALEGDDYLNVITSETEYNFSWADVLNAKHHNRQWHVGEYIISVLTNDNN